MLYKFQLAKKKESSKDGKETKNKAIRIKNKNKAIRIKNKNKQ